MKRTSLITASLVAILSTAASAKSLLLSELGNLELRFSAVQAKQQLPANPLPAEVSVPAGNTLVLSVPETIQQRHWLVANGSRVAAGQPLVLLQGAGAHHLQLQFAAAKEAFALAQQRYQHNQPLHNNGTIGAAVWQQISAQYFSAKLHLEHLDHFFELLTPVPAQQALQLAAPQAGIISYSANPAPLQAGDMLLGLTPLTDVRLKVQLPLAIAAHAQALATSNCQLTIASKANIAHAGFITAWSEPVSAHCQLALGQQLQVTPLLQQNVLAVPKQSVFSWGTGSRVLRHQGAELQPTDVTIVGVAGDNYLLQPNAALTHSEVLSQSVAAAKGVLLGLGGE